MAKHNELGKQGEQAAVEFLKKLGHIIIQQNYRYGKAEIDIISKEDNILVFTEVKTRSSNLFGFPEEFVDRKKIKLSKEAAENFTFQNNIDLPLRFDIISITVVKGELSIYHVMDAFLFEEDIL